MKLLIKYFQFRLVFALLLFSSFSGIELLLPTRQWVLANIGGGFQFLDVAETAVLFYHLIVLSFFSSWISAIILAEREARNEGILESMVNALEWFGRSLVFIVVGWGGILLIDTFAERFASQALFSFVEVLFSGIWITCTFALFPVGLASESNIVKSLLNSFLIGLKTAHRWFHLLLLLFLISGGLVFLWIPIGLTPDHTIWDKPFGWMVHFQWLGGFSFESNWYLDYSKSLSVSPSPGILWFLFLLNSLIATFIRIRVMHLVSDGEYYHVKHDEKISHPLAGRDV